ncbi:Gfo/Idh/MocA family protein [Deinococcus peraridilitoris]|uniref:Putative dehydrogenase n=1 Tax=Deinococcus peraridilitoris (strain DSM 19664 / LMG 22246 / CIP 109416 / KR-200) TaxID=937777 RepID=L0A064_DEIPD|nr:Gfo/Idh/MocA family oxidoreductase [Deinococcus peraridilitoris]AFZ67226.1 putative dehydrogenase [Deinococcus peraridilitoris DSM 19664]
MNVALIGHGSIAEDHAWVLRELAKDQNQPVTLRAVLGPEQQAADEFARQHGALYATTDFDQVLNDEHIHAVIICSPSDMHAQQTERCLRAGKHVLCEIPLALSLPETDRLLAIADQTDRRLMVCHTQRYWPSSREARRRVVHGELHPHALTGRYLFKRRENVNWKGRQRDWTDNLLWHHACHAVDLAMWLLNAQAVSVTAQVALPSEPLGIPMDLTISLRTPRDQLATVVMSYNTHMALHDYLVIGEEDTLLVMERELCDQHGPLLLRSEHAPILQQDAEFFAAVREEREPEVSARAVRPAMAVLQAAQEHLDALLAQVGRDACHPRLP